MFDTYRIIDVKREWFLQQETMGSKTKFWYRSLGQQENSRLFKYSQPNTEENWAEKIAAEIEGFPKFGYRSPGQQERVWLFKFPQPNTGEHWAEKIAAEIAGLLEIQHAKVELAVVDAQRGTTTESFAHGDREQHMATKCWQE